MKAWKVVKENKGAAGIDDVTIEQIEIQGLTEFLNDIQRELMLGSYRPKDVKRVYIPNR